MSKHGNVVSLKQFRNASEQALIDDISAQAFLFLREEAQSNKLPMKSVLLEHLLGIALVVKAVEGADESARILNGLAEQVRGED